MPSRLMIAVAAFAASIAFARADDKPVPRMAPINITIDKIDGQNLSGTTADGKAVAVTLAPDLKVTRAHTATVADVKAGQFIGCTAVEGPDGKLRATEIHVIPEAMRGAGEGHYPWGNAAKTSMTNGNVERLSGVSTGQTLKVSYKGGESEIQIPPNVTVTLIEVATADALKAGGKVTVYGEQTASGAVTAHYIGLAP